MSKGPGRHTPAFLLLFLAEAPAYGASLLSRLENELPYCFSDSAIVYRSLQEMERNGWIETTWQATETGQPRKWYRITGKGEEALEEQTEDIRRRKANFEFYLRSYDKLQEQKNGSVSGVSFSAGS